MRWSFQFLANPTRPHCENQMAATDFLVLRHGPVVNKPKTCSHVHLMITQFKYFTSVSDSNSCNVLGCPSISFCARIKQQAVNAGIAG